MTTVDEPSTWDRVIRRGTDHTWSRRRVDQTTGLPIIPQYAHAQVRDRVGGAVWLDLLSTAVSGPRIAIDPATGWVTVIIPRDATEDPGWDARSAGRWDGEVDVDGQRLRWWEGKIVVSQDVTRDTAP